MKVKFKAFGKWKESKNITQTKLEKIKKKRKVK